MTHQAYYSDTAIDVTREPFRITSLDVCGGRIVLGCSDGLVRVYEDRSGTDGKLEYKVTNVSKVFTKRQVDQLRVFPLQGIMVSLSDGIARLHTFPSLTTHGVFEKSRGCLSFAATHFTAGTKAKTDVLLLALALKRRIQIYRWQSREFRFQHRVDLSLGETPRHMDWAAPNIICAAFKREYKMIQIDSSAAPHTLFQIGRRGLVCSVGGGDTLLVLNNKGLIIDSKRKPTLAEPLVWSEPPNAALFTKPFLIVCNSSEVEIRNLESHVRVQSVPIKNGVFLASTSFGSRAVVCASLNRVLQLAPVPPREQLNQLVAKSNFEAALQLIKEDLPDQKWVDSRDANLEHVRTQYAYHLFNQRNFMRAMHLFQNTKINPRQVLSLFPPLVPAGQCTGVSHPDTPEVVRPVETKEVLLQACPALLSYLQGLRVHMQREHGAEDEGDDVDGDDESERARRVSSVASFDGGALQENGRMSLKGLVDIALLKVLIQMNPHAVMGVVQQPTECDLELTRKILSDAKMDAELVAFNKTRGQHEAALELLRERADVVLKSSPLHGPSQTIEYLKELFCDSKSHNLVKRYAEWVIKQYPKQGLEIFTHAHKLRAARTEARGRDEEGKEGPGTDAKVGVDRPGVDRRDHKEISPKSVLAMLKSWCDDKHVIVTYLESHIKTALKHSASLHNDLVIHYLQLIKQIQNEDVKLTKINGITQHAAQSNRRKRVQELREKLIQFLRNSRHYTPKKMLARLRDHDDLLEERAVLLSKLKQHPQALRIFVRKLQDIPAAVRYCESTYDAESKEDSDVFLRLLHVYLESKEEPMVKPAVELITKHFDKMDPVEAVGMLPADLPIQQVFPVLRVILSSNEIRSRRNKVVKALYRIRKLRVRADYIEARSQQVRIDNKTRCFHCKKKIGNAAFIRYPRHDFVVHYYCSEAFEKSFKG